MARKAYKYRELVKRLKKHDSRFGFYAARGKGSHRMIYHPDVGGRPASYPIICHGEGDEIPERIIAGIIRRFRLSRGVL